MNLDSKSYKILKVIEESIQVETTHISQKTGLTKEEIQKILGELTGGVLGGFSTVQFGNSKLNSELKPRYYSGSI